MWYFTLSFKAAFEHNITLLKKSHRKATEVLLLKHQREQELLQEEKERLLTEDLSDCLTGVYYYLFRHGLY